MGNNCCWLIEMSHLDPKQHVDLEYKLNVLTHPGFFCVNPAKELIIFKAGDWFDPNWGYCYPC